MVGEQLSTQERRNAIYTGEWLTEAKKYFSKNGCPAYAIASNYMKGSPIRQEYLETAIRWLASRDGKEIEDYMAAHQHDTNCNKLWLYFLNVINWVKATFPNYRKEIKGLNGAYSTTNMVRANTTRNSLNRVLLTLCRTMISQSFPVYMNSY